MSQGGPFNQNMSGAVANIETIGEKWGFRVNMYCREICLRGFCQSGGGVGEVVHCTWEVKLE